MREGLKALILPNKAPVIMHLNHMRELMILAHKAASGFKGRAHHIAPRCALYPTVKTLCISAHSVQLGPVRINRPAQVSLGN